MKLQWPTLILLLLALGLGGFLYFYQKQDATPRLPVAKAKDQQTFSFEADQVQFLRVKTKQQKLELELREKSGQPRWWMKTPSETPASDATVSYLMNLLVKGKSDRTIQVSTAQLQEYGLDQPLATIEVKLKNQKTHELILGQPDLNRNFLYGQADPPAKPFGSVDLLLASKDFENAVNRPLSEWKSQDASKSDTFSQSSNQPLQKESIKAKRDKWLWPFSSKSIWNMPIGSGAVYKPANIQPAPHVGGDQEYFYKIRAGAPLRPVYGVGSFGPGRCTGTQSVGISLPIPDNLIVPDATSTPYSTPNNASAFLMPDGQTLEQFEPLARCTAGGPVYGWRNPWGGVNIYGDGIKGGHLGSGLSSIGGSIRRGELTNTQPIRHALKIDLWGEKYLYYSAAVPGYRWPATTADANAAKQYHGTNPKLVLGTLLAIPPRVTPASLNLQTPTGKKLFSALQNYGAYVVDDAGWDAHYFCVEKGVLEEFHATSGYDFSASSGAFYDDYMKLVKALQIVDNNGAKNVGGGGTPRAPLAPPIGN